MIHCTTAALSGSCSFDLIFVIFSALQAHAAEQSSHQTEICSWQQEAELHSMAMEDEIPVWLLEEIMSI